MPLPDFADEKEFRIKWVAPFLSKMGFILPKHVHGADEQGKDFFFADFDRFGHLRFYAAPVKLGDIGTGAELTGLLDQIERCFEVTLKYHKGAHDQRISGVYVIVSGRISAQARERIWERCRQKNYGENIFFLDGETLDNLDRHSSFQTDQALRSTLAALLQEAVFNIVPTQAAHQTCLKGTPIFKKCRMLVLEQALKSPPPDDVLPYEFLSQAWEYLDWHNKRVVPYNLSYKDDQIPAIIKNTSAVFESNLRMRDACATALKILDDRYSLSIEIGRAG